MDSRSRSDGSRFSRPGKVIVGDVGDVGDGDVGDGERYTDANM